MRIEHNHIPMYDSLMKKVSLLSLTLKEMQDSFAQYGLKSFVAKQVCDWIYQKKVLAFADMSNISKANQELLEKHYAVSCITKIEKIQSEESAVKLIGKLNDGFSIEFVVLHQDGYNTLCVSSQCGCAVDCKFCLTGYAGFKRNLTVEEIVGQIAHAEQLGFPIRNLVFMGMGEPLLNYKNLRKAIDILTAEWGYDISNRKYTISTSGFKNTIQQLIDDEWYVNLAFSVGCTDPIIRQRIMPVEKHNPITEVSRLIKQYQSLHNRQLTLEYTLLEGVNDGHLPMKGLANLAKYLNAKVNLINLNPHKNIPFRPVSIQKLKSAQKYIRDQKIPVTIRYRKGQDIAAACGQLGESIIKETAE